MNTRVYKLNHQAVSPVFKIKILILIILDVIISCGSRRRHKGESHNKCEVLNLDNDKWQNITDYPYGKKREFDSYTNIYKPNFSRNQQLSVSMKSLFTLEVNVVHGVRKKNLIKLPV